VLGTNCKYPTIETLWAIHKSSDIVFEISYTWFLLGLPNNSVTNHKFESSLWWVKESSMYLSFNQLLYVSWKKLANSKNNNLQKNIYWNSIMSQSVELNIISWLSTRYRTCFLTVIISHVCLYEKLISFEPDSRQKIVTCKRNMLLIKSIHIKQHIFKK
jgi:hypothetical protein